jgi:hypothetical protein
MAPFYSLAGFLQDGGFEEKEIWGKWVKEWAEWVMKDLPRMFLALRTDIVDFQPTFTGFFPFRYAGFPDARTIFLVRLRL